MGLEERSLLWLTSAAFTDKCANEREMSRFSPENLYYFVSEIAIILSLFTENKT